VFTQPEALLLAVVLLVEGILVALTGAVTKTRFETFNCGKATPAGHCSMYVTVVLGPGTNELVLKLIVCPWERVDRSML
jgi:hypothetical protein